MKLRITALILVVVTVLLTFAGCGFNYAKEDLGQYTTFDMSAFEAALAKLEIEDGDYTSDPEIRAKKVMDKIYTTLAGKVDSDAKTTEGKIGAFDKVYYNYYATMKDENTTLEFFNSKMNPSSASNFQFGLSTTEGLSAAIEKELAKLDEIKDYVYKTSTENVDEKTTDKDGKEVTINATTKKNLVAYISYTLVYNDYEKDAEGNYVAKAEHETVYSYEKVVLGDENHPVAAQLVGKKINTTLDDIKTGSAETGDLKTYKSPKIHWVVEGGKEIIVEHTTYAEKKEETSSNGTKQDLKDKVLVYHVYPVYYQEVEDFNATTVLKTILTKLVTVSQDEDGNPETIYALPCLEDHKELAKALDELNTALGTAETEYETALKNRDTDKKEYDEAKAAYDEAVKKNNGQELSADANETKILNNKKKDLYGSEGIEEGKDGYVKGTENILKEKEEAKKNAENKRDEKIAEIIKALGENGEDTIVKEYNDTVHDGLVETYNNEIKMNLAKAVWELFEKHSSTIDKSTLPTAAVQAQYDIIMEQHEYTFYTGSATSDSSSSSSSVSNYKDNDGSFQKYLMEVVTKKSNYPDAKNVIWEQAQEEVIDLIIVYSVAKACNVLLTNDDINAAKKDSPFGITYDYAEEYYAKDSFKNALQFDKLMNYWLESETNEETDEVTYKKLSYKVK